MKKWQFSNLIQSIILGGILIANFNTSSAKSMSSSNFLFESASISRADKINPTINYYFSRPSLVNTYPIVILVGGSTDKEHLDSIANFHKYFSTELSQNKLGAISVDGWGADSNHINKSEFMNHYTRSQILSNYQQVIDHLIKHPPIGWNGKLAVLGVSEGGPIAEQLNEQNEVIHATVLWSGAIDSSWRNTLWLDMHNIYVSVCVPLKNPIKDCYDIATKDKFESRINSILANPSPESYFFNMTNMYVADGVRFPIPDYNKLHGAILVVTGAKDTIIDSSDLFYGKAKRHDIDITYWRVESMDHLIRKRPDLINNSFSWLANKLKDN